MLTLSFGKKRFSSFHGHALLSKYPLQIMTSAVLKPNSRFLFQYCVVDLFMLTVPCPLALGLWDCRTQRHGSSLRKIQQLPVNWTPFSTAQVPSEYARWVKNFPSWNVQTLRVARQHTRNVCESAKREIKSRITVNYFTSWILMITRPRRSYKKFNLRLKIISPPSKPILRALNTLITLRTNNHSGWIFHVLDWKGKKLEFFAK